MTKRTHVQLSTELWKKVNIEREPNQTFEETLDKMLRERDRLRQMIKVDPNAVQTRV
jgi:hypothetical protein